MGQFEQSLMAAPFFGDTALFPARRCKSCYDIMARAPQVRPAIDPDEPHARPAAARRIHEGNEGTPVIAAILLWIESSLYRSEKR
jgi:hypothetical protein